MGMRSWVEKWGLVRVLLVDSDVCLLDPGLNRFDQLMFTILPIGPLMPWLNSNYIKKGRRHSKKYIKKDCLRIVGAATNRSDPAGPVIIGITSIDKHIRPLSELEQRNLSPLFLGLRINPM